MGSYEVGYIVGTLLGPVILGLIVGTVLAGLRTLAAGDRRDPASKRRRWLSSFAIAFGVYTPFALLSTPRIGLLPALISLVCFVITLVMWATSPRRPAEPPAGQWPPYGGQPPPPGGPWSPYGGEPPPPPGGPWPPQPPSS